MAYVPTFETQTDQTPPWTDCTLTAGAMLVDGWSWGQRMTSHQELRAASGIPASEGCNFWALWQAIKGVEALDLQFSEWDGSGNADISWADLRGHLSSDAGGAAVAGNYGALAGWQTLDGLPINRWQPGGAFGHSVYVCDYQPDRGSVLWMDPLGSGAYAGDRISLDALWAFIYKSGSASERELVAAAYTMQQQRPQPVSAPLYIGEYEGTYHANPQEGGHYRGNFHLQITSNEPPSLIAVYHLNPETGGHLRGNLHLNLTKANRPEE